MVDCIGSAFLVHSLVQKNPAFGAGIVCNFHEEMPQIDMDNTECYTNW